MKYYVFMIVEIHVGGSLIQSSSCTCWSVLNFLTRKHLGKGLEWIFLIPSIRLILGVMLVEGALLWRGWFSSHLWHFVFFRN